MTIDAIVKTKTLQSPLGPPASVILMPKHINQQFTMQQGYNTNRNDEIQMHQHLIKFNKKKETPKEKY